MEYAAVFLAFTAAFILVYGLFAGTLASAQRVGRRLKVYTGRAARSPWGPAARDEEGLPAWQRLLRRLGALLARRGAYQQRLAADLVRAGIPMRPEEFVALQAIAAAGIPLLVLAVTRNPAGAAVTGIFGYALTKAAVARGKARRAQKLNDQLIDALSVMANSLRAGFSFFQAMDTVSREMPDPVGGEFARVLREVNLGRPVEEALETMAKRVESPDLDLIVTAVLIQRQVGGNLAEVLDTISETIRERLRIKGQIRTLTAQGRISGAIIGLLPIFMAALILVISPQYFKVLLTEKVGLAMLAGAGFSELMGYLFIKKITDIEV